VSGKGYAESLNSASHGAGRAMSRKAANEKFNGKDANRFLRERGVTLTSAALDEMPMAYKNIREVMAAQSDLVTVLGQSTHAMRHLLEAVPEVQEVAGDWMVRRLVEAVLGPKAFAVRSIFFDKTPEANWKVAWHQDMTIAVRKKIEVDG
jgi:hypothetical protein